MSKKRENHLVCLKGGTILTFDEKSTTIENGEIWLDGAKIVHVGEAGAFQTSRVFKTIDQRGRVICPGLINAHTHSYSSLLKGTVEREPLDIYMLSVIAKGSAMSSREIEVAAMLDSASMLLTGTTGVIDHFSERPALTQDGLEAVKRGFQNTGIRATIATMFSDLPYIESIPIDKKTLSQEISQLYQDYRPPIIEDYFSIMDNAVTQNSEESSIRFILGVDGPQRCSEHLMEMTGDFQKRHHCGLHTHMLETKTQAVMSDRMSAGFVRYMLDNDIIDAHSSLVHFVWADSHDIEAAREAGVTVVHCPASNLMLGAGVSPVMKLHQSGIPLAFGTDGSNCGPPSLLETMRLGCFLMRLTEIDFEAWPKATEILKSACSSGSRAMGWGRKTGIIEVGAFADLVSMDFNGAWHEPVGDFSRHLLYYENGSSVVDVWVNGRQVVKGKQLTTIDLDTLKQEASEIVIKKTRVNAQGSIADDRSAVSRISEDDFKDLAVRFWN